MSRLKILVVTRGVPWQPGAGGEYLYAFEAARHLAMEGHEVDMLVAAKPAHRRPLSWGRIVYSRVTTRWLTPLFLFRKAKRLLDAYDIVQSHGGEGALFASRRGGFGRPGIVSGIHYAAERKGKTWSRKGLWRRCQETSLRHADGIITCSEFMKAFLVSEYGLEPDRIRSAPGGISEIFLSEPPDRPTRSSPPYRILFVGELSRRKGLPTLLTAMKRLSEDLDVTLTLVGPPSSWVTSGRMHGQIADLKIQDRIEHVPQVNQEKLLDYYRYADVFCLPSRAEPLGLVLLEAMACRLPVVATRAGGIPEVVIHEKTGLLCEPEHPETLAKALKTMLSDKERRLAYGLEGRRRVESHFTWAHTARNLAGFYDELLSGKIPSR
jgi:glycosyltransferase involved in cell wall biosynthesis